MNNASGHIHNETHDDVCLKTEVTIAAFKTFEISCHTEQFIIAALRAAKALAVSLVAETGGPNYREHIY